MRKPARKSSPPPPASPKTKKPHRPSTPKADGIDLESQRGHEIIDRTIELCGEMLNRSEIVRKLSAEFDLSVAQCYRYYTSAWVEVRKQRMADHEVHVDEAVSSLKQIRRKCYAEKNYFAAMAAQDRLALIIGIKNPVADQGMNLGKKVDDDLSDDELQAIIARRAKRAGAGGGSSGPAVPPAAG